MRASTLALTSALILAGLVITGCDPGYEYFPVDDNGQPVRQWSRTIDGVSIEVGRFDTLVVDDRAGRQIDLVNNSGKTVTLLGAELSTGGHSIKGHVAEFEQRTFGPGVSGKVMFWFPYARYGGDAEHVLGESMTWTWRLRIGDQEHTVEVKMNRDRG
jgi:hypothetical protein